MRTSFLAPEKLEFEKIDYDHSIFSESLGKLYYNCQQLYLQWYDFATELRLGTVDYPRDKFQVAAINASHNFCATANYLSVYIITAILLNQ